jgi:DNA-binding PadR family transcriptional regulator
MKQGLRLTRREQQDLMDKTILVFLAKSARGVHWSDLEKKTLGTCHHYATSSRFRSRMRYLLNKNFIQKIEKGVYQITEAGRTYLQSLKLAYKPETNSQHLATKF